MSKPAGYTLTRISESRYRASRGPRHAYLTLIDGQWRQTTKDGSPVTKGIPPRDLERIVTVIEGEA
jgi:hypothetical protein